ncbi:(S)-ureidoglycine aminohydrolase-like [Papaver somniferum]|uniref:(S)-ureidoglycine aminohydrolase-like n=1 Tax=Papaver somniferum TaxID=3469 RepID=UPI000E6F8798|nr:(S)-ureidoglycine aminohydrolase-like [Papaver somniferum]
MYRASIKVVREAELPLVFIHLWACCYVLLRFAVGSEQRFCSAPPSEVEDNSIKSQYWKVTNPTLSPLHLQDLPGFTRSVYKRDHALITPESHVFSPLPEWKNTLGAYLVTPAMGAHFVMYLAKMEGMIIFVEIFHVFVLQEIDFLILWLHCFQVPHHPRKMLKGSFSWWKELLH